MNEVETHHSKCNNSGHFSIQAAKFLRSRHEQSCEPSAIEIRQEGVTALPMPVPAVCSSMSGTIVVGVMVVGLPPIWAETHEYSLASPVPLEFASRQRAITSVMFYSPSLWMS